jgi:hypothetical protein
MKESKEFQLQFENIPLVNLRIDFKNFKKYVDKVLQEEEKHKISTTSSWHNNRFEIEEEFNNIMRLSVMGIESYVKAAVWDQLHRNGQWNREIANKLKNPFSMSRKVYEVYYHSLPSLISANLSLKNDNRVWSRTVVLYNEVRNPLFHGYQAVNIKPAGIGSFFDHLSIMYRWIDEWYNLDF